MSNINKKNVSKAEAELVAAYNNLITFGKLFLPGDFLKSKTPAFHYEIADELISDSNKPCAIVVPRGHAKTTLIKASIVRDFCFAKKAKEWGLRDYEEDLFFGWVSSNQKKSKNNVAYVKLHLNYNEMIKYYFGKTIGTSLRGETWNQEDLVTAYGDRLVSSSNLSSMRGDTLATLGSGSVRYSRVFVDDAENEDNTRTLASREKIVDNIMNGILPAIEKNRPGCRLFLIETPVHYDCFAQNILDKWEKVKKLGQEEVERYSWKVITYKATQPNMPGGVLWDSYLPRKRLDLILQTYIDSPRGPGGYYQEYELEVQSSEDSVWTRNHLKFWEGYFRREGDINYLIIDNMPVPVNTFIGCDPATDIDTKYADYSVIMVIAVDMANNVYVVDYERHRAIPTLSARDKTGEIIDKKGVVDYIIDMYQKYNCSGGTVEDVAMTRSIFQSLNSEKRRLNKWDVNIVPGKPGGRDKINRIYSGLNSRFSAGSIYVKESQHDLINEIIKFGPKMSHDDTIESLYYACSYCYPPNLVTGEFDRDFTKRSYGKPKNWKIA